MEINQAPLIIPTHEPDGEFTSKQQWINKATSWIGGMNALCVDAKGRRCLIGLHFDEAEKDNAYPIRFWYGYGGQTKAQQQKSKRNAKATLKAMYPWRY